MGAFTVAGIQMPVPVTGNNIAAMQHMVEKTLHIYPWVEMVVFSELAMHGPLSTLAKDDPTADEAAFSELAQKFGVWICPGSQFVRRGESIYNHAVVIDPRGEIAGRYDKMYPFRPFESGVESGSDYLIFDVAGVGRFGLLICYDLWFPETTRTLTANGVEVLIHPVLTGTIDRSVELAIAQATGAMFQCYVVDVNGLDAGGVGCSLVVDPTGMVIHQAGQNTEIFPVDIDLDLVRRVRDRGAHGVCQTLKSFRDGPQRFSVYDSPAGHHYLQSLGELRKPDRYNDPTFE